MAGGQLLKKFEPLHSRQKLLKKCISRFDSIGARSQKYSHIEIGIELEFYLINSLTRDVASDIERESFISLFNLESQILFSKNCKKDQKIDEIFCKTEQGNGQIEIVFKHRRDLLDLCKDLDLVKKNLEELAEKSDFEICFAGQPFVNDCGSALQFNISLHDKAGKNLFSENNLLAKKYAKNLLDKTNEMMIFLAPDEGDYLRFSYDLNRKLHKNGKYTAPVNLSLGKENRSCAIRLAQKCQRLEYRIASASADAWISLSCLLLVLCDTSIAENDDNLLIEEFQEIYGNSFDEQYKLTPLLSSLDEAKRFFLKKNNFFRRKLEEALI